MLVQACGCGYLLCEDLCGFHLDFLVVFGYDGRKIFPFGTSAAVPARLYDKINTSSVRDVRVIALFVFLFFLFFRFTASFCLFFLLFTEEERKCSNWNELFVCWFGCELSFTDLPCSTGINPGHKHF
jgi:hypothetical protein